MQDMPTILPPPTVPLYNPQHSLSHTRCISADPYSEMSETEAAPATPIQEATPEKVDQEKKVDEKTVDVSPKNGGEETAAKPDDEEKSNAVPDVAPPPEDASTFYEFCAKDIDGNEVSMEKYRGHPTVVVNVATNCGFTKTNYKQLNELYAKYEEKGLRIAAFPCNQFFSQESGCDVDIKEFAAKNNVQFDMYSKIDVNGENAIPLYKWLKSKQGGILGFNSIKWNFTKFLINKDGIPIKRFGNPASDIEPDVKALLPESSS